MEEETSNKETVLVTGGSGFIGAHTILQLLAKGYNVRTTIRNLNRESEVRGMLKTGGAEPGEALSFFAADLMSDTGWKEAIAGCDYVQHIASPFPAEMPKDENDLIGPAREGALRVLRAARDAGVKRVVMTSSFAAVGYTPKGNGEPFTEKDWTNPDTPGITAYVKSKTLAEKAAWNFMANEGGNLELAVINPTGVLGPVLANDYSTSIQMVKRLLDGAMPGCPQLSFGLIDVRDVADLHIKAMTNPAAKGERFIAIAGKYMRMKEIAIVLKERMGDAAAKAPTRELPNWLVRLMSVFDPSLKLITPELGRKKEASNEKAKKLLGWAPRPNDEAIVATGESMVRLGLLKK